MYYKEIKYKSMIRKELLEFCINDTDWRVPEKGTFSKKSPPIEILKQDLFLSHIVDNYIPKFGDISLFINIFLLNPWTHYMLHQDKYRSASINMVLNNEVDSITYFQKSDPIKLHMDIEELVYKHDSYYLFNSKIPHAVINRKYPRYLLSITLDKSYDQMAEILKNHILCESGTTLI